MDLWIYSYEYIAILWTLKLYIVRKMCALSYHQVLEIRFYIQRLPSKEFVVRPEEYITRKQWTMMTYQLNNLDKSLSAVINTSTTETTATHNTLMLVGLIKSKWKS